MILLELLRTVQTVSYYCFNNHSNKKIFCQNDIMKFLEDILIISNFFIILI